jgi:hypothetical protein
MIFHCRQLVTNCRSGKADEALSFWFLMQWLLGDVTNLIGAVLTRQLATQVREGEEEGGRERDHGGILVFILTESCNVPYRNSLCVRCPGV